MTPPKPYHSMSRDEQRAFAAETARAERVAQGLPPVIVDPVMIDQLERAAAPVLTPDASEAAA